MKEYEIYLPATDNDGAPIDPGVVARFKDQLADAFGGYTHFTQRSEGAWSMGGVRFRDEITLVRVLDDGKKPFDMRAFKRAAEEAFRQESILIVERDVRRIQ